MELLLIMSNRSLIKDEQFTKQERLKIRQAIAEARQRLKALSLSPKHRHKIGIHLEQMARRAHRHCPIDWQLLFTGSLTTLLMALSVPAEIRKAVWIIVEYVFGKYLG
jgi:hypothetical protein